ncbi:YARHG domain-containing protein [Aureimonas phyllosphaerae]|uniref:YARHG domain-containing protein n=1 Tax=Aureimonas phyllosphaerae TaxID=1166078 RepID=A0A7W6BWI5_9HYPH|nr:YARHG domain-containing protein [Aureimonas phyllosphaerae]MBB3937359.1 hypothetical protein [Aureimonas phyllosphaerae]MBB3961366.1 hypothetical protein [Aureimonas phyllosphaerae]SFF42287.1 SH3 domain-containing protein [Aureimonas phyllosphaerae]
MPTLRRLFLTLALSTLAPFAAHADGGICARDPSCDFRFPTSGFERIRPEWLADLPSQTLWEARNEIMARHGYAFDTPRAMQVFGSKGWYRPTTRNVALSAVEKANIDLIRAFEEGRGDAYLGSVTTRAPDTATYEVVGLDANGDGFLSVRGGPGGKFRELGRIYQADRVTVMEASGRWLHLRYAGGEGWSHSRYLRPIPSAPAAVAVAGAASSSSVHIEIESDASRTDELREDLSVISGQLHDLSTQVAQREVAASIPQPSPERSAAKEEVEALKERIATLEAQRSETTEELRTYETPVRPENSNLQTDARRSSERYQKVPYFVPGTKTVGEMWVEPKVDDAGQLRFDVNFIDPEADYQKIAIAIPMTPDEIGRLETALSSVEDWSRTATEKKIRKRYEKEAVCLPAARCEGSAAPTSGLVTRILFQIDDDGSTATLLRTRQGSFERAYAFSMESTAVLRKYLRHVADVGASEFQAGSATKEDLDALFQ